MHLCRSSSNLKRICSHAYHGFWKCDKTIRFCSFLTKCTVPCPCHAKRHPNLQKWREHVVLCAFSLRHVLRATMACAFSTSELPKVARTCGALYIFTSKCASRHNGVRFFDISTAKSSLHLVCFVHFHFEMCFASQRRALFRHRNFQKCSENGVLCTFWLRNVLRATTARTFSTSERPKVLCTRQFFALLTWKYASRHNGVHFFVIWTSKSGLRMVCFVHFDFEMCFAPQRRALFRHRNFQKCSENGVLCTFWLRNVLRATTACTLSTSQLPKVVWHCGALYILTSKCASRHNGVQLFGQLALRLPLQRAYLSTLRSPKSLEKHSVSRLSYVFSHLHLLSSYSFSSTFFLLIFLFSLPLPCSAFICPCCRKFDF